VAQIFSVFANQGALAHSHLLASEEETDEWSEVISPDTAYKMNRMLRRVVLEGTGKGADVSGLEVYGKTGTAETAGSVHAWFGGHVQIPDGRQLAFGVLVEDGGVGGRAAAPLVKDFLTRSSSIICFYERGNGLPAGGHLHRYCNGRLRE